MFLSLPSGFHNWIVNSRVRTEEIISQGRILTEGTNEPRVLEVLQVPPLVIVTISVQRRNTGDHEIGWNLKEMKEEARRNAQNREGRMGLRRP